MGLVFIRTLHLTEIKRHHPQEYSSSSAWHTHLLLRFLIPFESMFRNIRIYSSLSVLEWLTLHPPANPWPSDPTLFCLLHPDWREQQNSGFYLVAGGAGCPVVSTPQCVLSAPAGQVNEQVSDRSVSHILGVWGKVLMFDCIIYNQLLCTASLRCL